MAGFGQAFALSKEEVRTATPPGTTKLIDHDLERTTTGTESSIDHIRLVPTPSRDSADPLNWPAWRKAAVLTCISIFPFVANFQSASISSALPYVAMEFHPPQYAPVTVSQLTRLISVNALMLGASNLFWVPLANIFGRRPIILISVLLMTFSCMWAGLAKSYASLLAARVFAGVGGGSADTLCPDIVGEVWFRHQRGRIMAVYTVALTLGPIVGGLVGSYIAADHGWRWTQWVNVILSGFTFLICLVMLPETLFDRNAALAVDVDGHSAAKAEAVSEGEPEKTGLVHKAGSEASASLSTYRPYTFARSLQVKTYRGGWVRQFIAPWLTLRLPGVWVVMLQYAGLVGGIVTISAVAPQLVSVPPYLWKQNAGLVNVGGLIGAALGGLFTYIFVDRILTNSAKHARDGLSEPESRLPALFPGLFLATFGLLVFGLCGQNPSKHAWVGLEFGYGMLAFGLMQIPSVGFNYLIESYHSVSSDCFVMVTVFRAIISFAWTFFVSDWIQSRGAAEPFGIFTLLMGVFSLLTIPLYIFGKRLRIATALWVPKQESH